MDPEPSRFYGSISSIVRLLIVATALVAAEKALKQYLAGHSEVIFVSFSLMVAIGTALDAWLKPREKWRGFLADRDEANILSMKARNVDKTDLAKIEALLEELCLLKRRHIEKNVY